MSSKKEYIFESNNQFRTLFEHSHDAMIISNKDKSILLANNEAERMFGYEKDKLNGMNILELMPPDRRGNYDGDLEKVIKGSIVTNRDDKLEFLGQKLDGKVFPIELTFSGWQIEKEHFFTSQIRDISRRKSYENKLKFSNRSLLTTSECNKALVNAVDEISYYQDVCDTMVVHGEYKVAWIGLIKHDETKSIEPVAYKGFEKGYFEDDLVAKGRMTWRIREDRNTGPTARAINSKEIAFCNNIQTDPKYDFWSEEAKELGFNSSISIPLRVDENVESVLIILSENHESCDKEEIKFLEQLSDDISFGIKTLRLKKAQAVVEDHLKDKKERLLLSNRYLQVMSESNKVLAKSNTVEEYLENICKIIVKTGGHVKSLIQRINYGESVTIDNLGMYGNSSGEYVEKFLLQNVKISGLTERCVYEKRPIVSLDIIGSGNYIYWSKDQKKVKFQSVAVIPMIKDDMVIGALRVYSAEPFSFGKKELELLQNLSSDILYGTDLIKSKQKRVLVENKLTESEDKYKNLFQYSNDAIFLADAETGIIIDANIKAEELLRVEVNDIIGMHQTDLHPSKDREKYESAFKKHIKSKQAIDEFYIVNKEGKHIPVHVSASTMIIDGKKIVQGIFRDVSKTKLIEENLRSTQKMEALGTLSGGIAHDFNNILTPIIGYTELAKMELDSKKGAGKYLTEVIRASNRAKELVNQILTFCRKNDFEVKPFRIQPIIKEVLKLLSPLIPSTIEIRSDISPNCGSIMCDPTQIHQVVMNLCTNAYHAMKESGGILKVKLNCGETKDFITDEIETIDFEKCLCLEISDTGHGMDKLVLERIFEPYFTTKGQDEGTGLGLSVVLGIVKGHGGKIYARSQPGEGSLFKIYLPILEDLEFESQENEIECIPDGKEHILVVDDEQILTEIISVILKELGYKTTQFNSSKEALEDFKMNSKKYDMVFTDQTMPGMIGSDLAKKILEVRSDIPIILCTGYSPLIDREEAIKIGIKEFLMKPITTSVLGVTVRRVLDENKILI
ncbi:MAG: PAS domain S-box protein [Candidatus Delongbacteria bacterium]|jgi:PAS domain S-box-containing protein|nr:PAS domain S-box protein [Candidatus Delongbacteria bacterium]